MSMKQQHPIRKRKWKKDPNPKDMSIEVLSKIVKELQQKPHAKKVNADRGKQ